MRKFLLLISGLFLSGCAGPCVSPTPLGIMATSPLVIPMVILNPRSYHGKDGYSHWNAIPYPGIQKLTAIDRFERDYIANNYEVAPNFMVYRERWGMYDKITFRQVNGKKRLLYFDTFPNDVAARGIEPAKPGT